MTQTEIAALDAQARKVQEKVATVAGTVYLPAAEVEWLYQHLAGMADEIVKPLFGFEAPTIILSIDKDHRKRLGHYKPYRDGLGFKWRVSINALHLGRGRADVLRTLLHEALHACQEAHGKPGKGNYHNAQFREWCEKAGIPTDDKGHDRGTTENGPFHAYLKRHGIEGKVGVTLKPKPGGSNLKKWDCECGEQPVRTTRETLEITCNLCGTEYRRVS